MSAPRTAEDLGIIGCRECGLVCQADTLSEDARCPRCSAKLHRRKPNSISRTWALLIAAIVMYVPSNLLPIMYTSKLNVERVDTIISGVATLWMEGERSLATIVFVASVVVPIIKIAVLSLLLITAQTGSRWRQLERAKLYRLIHTVGHWSMLDIFVVLLLVTLVQLHFYGQVHAGPAALAFGAVVILTMLAAMSFDSRLIWDAPESRSRSTPSPVNEPRL